jgi:hypothetical protein
MSRFRSVWIFLSVPFVAAISAARADLLSYTDSVPLMTTDWKDTVTLPRFDPALGTLDAVSFRLSAHIEGTAFYENQDPGPADVQLRLSAILTLARPDHSILLTANPSTLVMETAAGNDGVLDFDGPAGSTFNNLIADLNANGSSPPPASDLLLFTGISPIVLPVTAYGDSYGKGPGNWIFGFLLAASAEVEVTYDYTPIPEPASLALALLGAWPMLMRRRRQFRIV